VHADPGAARLAKILGLLVNLGPEPDRVVSEWWPTFLAAGAEYLRSSARAS